MTALKVLDVIFKYAQATRIVTTMEPATRRITHVFAITGGKVLVAKMQIIVLTDVQTMENVRKLDAIVILDGKVVHAM
jgi:hypothetical protein